MIKNKYIFAFDFINLELKELENERRKIRRLRMIACGMGECREWSLLNKGGRGVCWGRVPSTVTSEPSVPPVGSLFRSIAKLLPCPRTRNLLVRRVRVRVGHMSRTIGKSMRGHAGLSAWACGGNIGKKMRWTCVLTVTS